MCVRVHLNLKISPVSKTSPLASARPIAPPAVAPSARRIQTRNSTVHGKGVFAVAPLAEGETVIEYTGELITWKEALRRHPHDPRGWRLRRTSQFREAG